MLIGRNHREGEKGMGDGGNRTKELKEAHVKVSEQVWENKSTPLAS